MLTWSSMTVTHAWCSQIVTLSCTAWLQMLCKSISSSCILLPGCRCVSYCHKFKPRGLLKRTYKLRCDMCLIGTKKILLSNHSGPKFCVDQFKALRISVKKSTLQELHRRLSTSGKSRFYLNPLIVA